MSVGEFLDRVADVLVAEGDLGIQEVGIGIPLDEIRKGVEFHPTKSG